MDRRTAKEFLHLREWLAHAELVAAAGEIQYRSDPLLQEAGDSLLMKIGETANRLARAGVEAPDGIDWSDAIGSRNVIAHQYDEIDRTTTWGTLATDLPDWRRRLAPIFMEAERALGLEPETNE